MIKTGDKVSFRFFNTPEKKFYGDFHTGIISGIKKDSIYYNAKKIYTVRYTVPGTSKVVEIELKRKEIKTLELH